MIAFSKLLLVALSTLSTLVSTAPVDAEERQLVARAVGAAASPVVLDAQGIYPRATRLKNGSLLAGYATYENGNAILRTARSTNNGASWTRLGIVDQGPSAARDIDNAFVLALPDGRILYAFRNHDKAPGGGYTQYRITVCVSTDGGVTWSFLSHVNQHAANGFNGLWEPFLRVDRSGAIQCYYSSENANNDQDNIMQVSTNGGASWGPIIGVSGGNVVSRDGMTGVAEAPNGDMICVFENTEGGGEHGPYSVDIVRSTNDGYTWGSRTRIYTPVNGRDAGAPQIIRVGGNLVVSFMSNEAGGNNAGFVDNGEMKVITSGNNGFGWSGATVVSGIGTHWPGIFGLDGSTWLALFTFNGRGCLSQKWTV